MGNKIEKDYLRLARYRALSKIFRDIGCVLFLVAMCMLYNCNNGYYGNLLSLGFASNFIIYIHLTANGITNCHSKKIFCIRKWHVIVFSGMFIPLMFLEMSFKADTPVLYWDALGTVSQIFKFAMYILMIIDFIDIYILLKVERTLRDSLSKN